MSVTTPEALAAEFANEARTAGKKAGTVVIATAAAIQRDAKLFAPVDTGMLRSSITRESTRTVYGASSEIGPEVNYGAYVEEGTWRMAAQPYLTPAAERNTGPFVETLAAVAGWDRGSITLGRL